MASLHTQVHAHAHTLLWTYKCTPHTYPQMCAHKYTCMRSQNIHTRAHTYTHNTHRDSVFLYRSLVRNGDCRVTLLLPPQPGLRPEAAPSFQPCRPSCPRLVGVPSGKHRASVTHSGSSWRSEQGQQHNDNSRFVCGAGAAPPHGGNRTGEKASALRPEAHTGLSAAQPGPGGIAQHVSEFEVPSMTLLAAQSPSRGGGISVRRKGEHAHK